MELVLPLALFVGLYFLMIRPQQRKVKEHQQLVAALEVGDDVVTSGGIYGAVTAIDGEVLRLEIADGVEILLARDAIAELVEYASPDDDDAEQD